MQSGCQAKDGADAPSSPEYRLHLDFVDGKLMELPKDVKPEIGGSLQPQNNESVSGGRAKLEGAEVQDFIGIQMMNGVPVTREHFCGGEMLGHLALDINSTEQNKHLYVRKWTRKCCPQSLPLVFDVDGNELANPSDAHNAVNAFDALKAVGVAEHTARRLAGVDKIMKHESMPIDPRHVFKIHWDGNPRVSVSKMFKVETMFNFYSTLFDLYHGTKFVPTQNCAPVQIKAVP